MKTIVKRGFIRLGGDHFLRKRNRVPRVLFWHGVDKSPHPLLEAESIDLVAFVTQIEYLEKHYKIICIDSFYERYQSHSFKGNEVVLTFDDGYKNNLKVLAPIMKAKQLPFTVFISTDHISNGSLFPTSILRLVVFGSTLNQLHIPSLDQVFPIQTLEEKTATAKALTIRLKTIPLAEVEIICDELVANVSAEEYALLQSKYTAVRPMTWDEVRTLAADGCTIGSHAVDHICCHADQEETDIQAQIEDSKRIIEQELQQPCHYFAYPYGGFTDYSNACVKDAGYKMGFSTENTKVCPISNEKEAIPRLGIPADVDEFKYIVNAFPKFW